MNLKDWRTQRQAAAEMTLPSGLEVKLRKVVMLDLVANGHIPATLDALVQKATSDGFGVNDVKEFIPLVNAVVQACVVEPALAAEGDDEHLTLDEIPIMDRLEIFNWANGAANALRPFPGETESGLEPARAGDGILQSAE
jgi:hypothetical protein